MFNIGDRVTVGAPFSGFFPDVYTIQSVSDTGAFEIVGGVDFAPEHLILYVE